MIAPAIVFLIIFTYWPLINLVQLSFQDYNMINPAKTKFVGLQNFYNILFVKDDFIVALKNTSVYTCCVVIFLILFAILFALWVKKDTWQNYFAQTAFFTPHIIAMISCGMVWAWIMDTDRGILNTVFNFFGLPSLRWLNSSKTAMLSVVIVSVWKNIGYYALIIISSLKSIPTEIYEAAELDNTPRGRKFFRITLPMISPQLFFLLITITIGSFKVFDTIRVMTDGGPGSATDVVAYYIYRYAFHHFRIGLAAAAGVVLMIVMIIMTIIYFKVLAKKVFYQ
ncbi:sugar ABC transporter permease [Treponema parvum]|uniref:Sugar ABC transporter permease n=2 Tax=Treponema parvum TaxID=138851 RepID=A0A975F6B2_9SPIR|nr:sugar ABC transporter permease [Treponema parvum]